MASPFIIDHPSPPLPSPTSLKHTPTFQSRIGTEAFPDFPSSPASQSSPASHHGFSQQTPQTQAQRANRQFRSSSNRLPATALLSSGRDASRTDLTSPTSDHNRDHDEQPQQRLPRAKPAPSLSGPSIRPTGSVAPGLLRGSTASAMGRTQPNAEEIKSESLWADMQRTLADVELSAMNSSHLFNAPHSQALDKLRETQLALAQAWARSEADEVEGLESEDEYLNSEPEGGMQSGVAALRNPGVDGVGHPKGPKGKPGRDHSPKDKRPRKGSAGSHIGRDLEEETERDIRLARKRREANDHYFSQVNRGVLDVVSRLDEVASAMRAVEKESRAVWEEMGGSGSTTGSGSEMEADTDGSEKPGAPLTKEVTKATNTTGTVTGSGTEMSDSPGSPKQKKPTNDKLDAVREGKKSTKDKGR